MRNWFLVFLFACALGVSAFGGYYVWQQPAVEPPMANELEWLREEFRLDEGQFEKVEAIHIEYRPKCDDLCQRVIEAQERLDEKMVASTSFTPEIEEELARYSQVKEECHRAMLEHVYSVAAVMDPEERRRYLEKAKAQVTMHDRIYP